MFRQNNKESAKVKFIKDNLIQMVQLEKSLHGILNKIIERQHQDGESGSLAKSKRMIKFKDVFQLQKVFKDENLLMPALTFIQRITVYQNNETRDKKQKNSSSDLYIKVNENFGEGVLTFVMKSQTIQGIKSSEIDLKDLIQKSVFKNYITALEFEYVE